MGASFQHVIEVGERLFYMVTALSISFCFTLTMLLMVIYKMSHCIRILNTLLSSRIKWIHFRETVLNILTVLASIPSTAYWMMACLSLKNTMSLDIAYEIFQSRNRIGIGKKRIISKVHFCTQVCCYTVSDEANPSFHVYSLGFIS